MRQFYLSLLSCFLLLQVAIAAHRPQGQFAFDRHLTKTHPKIAIAGLGIESSTFSPALTDEAAFHAAYGPDVFKLYPFLAENAPMRQRAAWVPILVGHALPGGAVTRKAYESLVNKTLEGLRKNGPYDGLLFDIHGAMSVVGLEDPEGDFIIRIRKVIGKSAVISTTMDLHGNVSWRLAENTDLITCYRMAPHEDELETKERAAENLLTRIENKKGKPRFKAWIPIPILLPGEKTSTRIEAGKSVYAAVAPASRQKGIIDAAIWVGYAWADEARNHAVVMVTGDDKDAVSREAEQLARRFWNARFDFVFVAPTATLEACLDSASRSPRHPFYISDMGDNPTAGGSGDVTWTLTQILARPEFKAPGGPSLIYASLPGPEFVAKAIAAGIGGNVDGYAGAKVDYRYSPPIHLKGKVTSIQNGDKDAEVEVVVQVGNVHIIVTQKRKPYHHEIDFTRLGLNPRTADVVVVKIGYLEPELYAMKADWIMALTPGGVDQNLEGLTYRHIIRPMYPFDKKMTDPDLSVKFVPPSDLAR